ncbi:5-formyltetrahydrofolate cyclo-ligase [Saccharothrix violaceirubra]
MSAEGLAAVEAFGVVPGGTVCAYWAVGSEPGSRAMLDALSAFRVLLPVVAGDGPLDWAVYAPDALRAGPYGLLEPSGPLLGVSAVASAAVVLVPALAVDHAGVRLGKGGGYYDRTLAAATGALVAVVRDEEFVEVLPAEPHDVRMDAVVTPGRGVVRLPL